MISFRCFLILRGFLLCPEGTIQVNVVNVRFCFGEDYGEVVSRRFDQIYARHFTLLFRHLLLQCVKDFFRGEFLVRFFLRFRDIYFFRVVTSRCKRASILTCVLKWIVNERRGRCRRPRRRRRRRYASTKNGRLRVRGKP